MSSNEILRKRKSKQKKKKHLQIVKICLKICHFLKIGITKKEKQNTHTTRKREKVVEKRNKNKTVLEMTQEHESSGGQRLTDGEQQDVPLMTTQT